MKISLAAVLSLGTVSTLLAVTDGAPLRHRENALNTRSCTHDRNTDVATIGSYTSESESDYLKKKRDELDETIARILVRAGPLISPKGPKGKDGDSTSDAAPVSFTGGTGDKTDPETAGGLDGPIIDTRPPSDRQSGEGSGARPPVPAEAAPVTASTFSNPKDEATRQVGESRVNDLRIAISTNRADKDRGSVESNGYIRTDDPDMTNPARGPLENEFGMDRGRYLSQFGIQATKDMKAGPGKVWQNLVVKNREGSGYISQYAVSASQKAIILKDSRAKDNDENLQPGGDPDIAMKLRDMTIDSWRSAAGNPEAVKELKWIVRNDVVTDESKVAIDAAFAKAGADPKKKAVFRSDSQDPNELAAYQQVAGSFQLRGIVQMLSDHHQELGNLQIVALHVFTNKNTEREKARDRAGNLAGYYAIVTELGRR